MIYGSVCSGIEAATAAWHPLGWKPAFFSEIEKFPSAVLAHHYPNVPNLGDMTKFKEWPDAAINVLVGGTPCQSFSVAGLRKGLDDPRGNLMLTYLAIAERYRPQWLVWENVPGVLSSNGGRDFGTFLGALGQLGYGFAYRVLDAQYFGVAQRRRRVFVVANLGNWRAAAAVLFERESMLRNPPPSREAGANSTGTVTTRAGSPDRLGQYDSLLAFGGNNTQGPIDVATAVNACGSASGRMDFESETFVTGPLCHNSKAAGSATNQDAESGMLVPTTIPLHDKATRHAGKHGDKQDGAGNGLCVGNEGDPMYTLTSGDRHAVAAFKAGQGAKAGGIGYSENVAPTLSAAESGTNRVPALLQGMAVRRLTPIECERLQGFKDGFTQIPWRGKLPENCPDGPRYKSLGNSMAVPVMHWIGKRIQQVDAIMNEASIK